MTDNDAHIHTMWCSTFLQTSINMNEIEATRELDACARFCDKNNT